MPFHATSIVSKIKDDIKNAQFSVLERVLLEIELKRKQNDRFNDKSSLYEYSDLLTVLGRGYIKSSDYPSFSVLPDPEAAYYENEEKIRERLEDNHYYFDLINRAVKHGNIEEDLENIFKKSFIDTLKKRKKDNIPWYDGLTYQMVLAARVTKPTNPLQIENHGITVFSGMILEYSFEPDTKFFVRDDGTTKAKRRILLPFL